jgi:hypothetical protein
MKILNPQLFLSQSVNMNVSLFEIFFEIIQSSHCINFKIVYFFCQLSNMKNGLSSVLFKFISQDQVFFGEFTIVLSIFLDILFLSFLSMNKFCNRLFHLLEVLFEFSVKVFSIFLVMTNLLFKLHHLSR